MITACAASGEPTTGLRDSLPQEHAAAYCVPGRGDALVLNARYRRQRFAPHFHDCYAIGLVTDGALKFRCERGDWVATIGSLCLVNPGQVHTGEAGGSEGWSYWNAYLPVEVVDEIAGELYPVGDRARCFASPVVKNPAASHALRTYFAAVERRSEPIVQGELLTQALAQIMGECLGTIRQVEPRPSPGLVAKAREYMAEHYADSLSLDDVADVVGVSGFHLTRLFKITTGLNAHSWLVQYRVERARQMLLDGTGVAETAAACGFSDQAHLSRWLKRLSGLTPGQFRAVSRTTAK